MTEALTMACYNREFLVPYLNNLCALELARIKTHELLNQANGEIARLDQAINSIQMQLSEPEPPRNTSIESEKTEENANEWGKRAAACAVGCIVAFLVANSILASNLDICVISSLACVACFSGTFTSLYWMVELKVRARDAADTLEKRQRAYEAEVKAYKAHAKKIKSKRNHAIAERDRRLPGLNSDIKLYKTKIGELNTLIDRAYRANVVPVHYRNVYAVWYLSGYFSSSGANDVDAVLQTFVLEQIKERLDRTIEQQQRIIFNQQLAYAELVAARTGQKQFRNEMVGRLDRIGTGGEERERYLSMIDSNVRATFWMSVAGYLKK
jgi:hypothetical protein